MAIQLLTTIATNGLVLGFMPESMALLMFGLGLIGLTIGVRWWLDRSDKVTSQAEEKR